MRGVAIPVARTLPGDGRLAWWIPLGLLGAAAVGGAMVPAATAVASFIVSTWLSAYCMVLPSSR